MRVPAAAPRDVITTHDLIAREHILEGARQYMVHSRLSIRGGGSLIENIFRLTLTLLNGLLENIGLLPKFQHTFFHQSYIEFWAYRFEHDLSPSLSSLRAGLHLHLVQVQV